MTIRYHPTKVGVTTHRFSKKTEWLRLRTEEISINDIEGVKMDQSIPGRLFGYGVVTIEGTGVDAVKTPMIADPLDLRRAVETARSLAFGITQSPALGAAVRRAVVLLALTLGAVPCLAQSGGPRVSATGLAPGTTLELHAAPDPASAVVARLPADAQELVVTAQASDTLDWLYIASGATQGWAEARWLAYCGAADVPRLPLRLSCRGAHPDFTLEVSYSRVNATIAGRPKTTLGVDAPEQGEDGTGPWLLGPIEPTATYYLLLRAAQCAAAGGGSFALAARIDGTALAGCCR